MILKSSLFLSLTFVPTVDLCGNYEENAQRQTLAKTHDLATNTGRVLRNFSIKVGVVFCWCLAFLLHVFPTVIDVFVVDFLLLGRCTRVHTGEDSVTSK